MCVCRCLWKEVRGQLKVLFLWSLPSGFYFVQFYVVCILPTCMSVYTCVFGAHRGQKWVLDSLEPECELLRSQVTPSECVKRGCPEELCIVCCEHGRVLQPGERKSLPLGEAWTDNRAILVCMQMLVVCAKITKHSFLHLDDCNLRLVTFPDLLLVPAKPSSQGCIYRC